MTSGPGFAYQDLILGSRPTHYWPLRQLNASGFTFDFGPNKRQLLKTGATSVVASINASGDGAIDFPNSATDGLSIAGGAGAVTELDLLPSPCADLWFVTDNAAQTQVLAVATEGGGTENWALFLQGGFVVWRINNFATTMTSTLPVAAGALYHACGWYDAATGIQGLDVNGVVTTATPAIAQVDRNPDLDVGVGYGLATDARIEDLALWNRPPTEREILARLKAGMAGR
jgi:hypothetical protein